MTKTILIAEDEPSVKKLIVILLEAEGFTVLTCDNGVEAVKFLNENYFDLLICDQSMPHMTGSELSEYVRNNLNYRELPILMTSAEHDPKLFANLIETRVINTYLPKPFNIKQFVSIVKAMLQQSKRINPLINKNEYSISQQ